MRHIVALSGGKDSTAMALRLKELHPEIDFEYVCTPTGNELPEMVEHWVNLGRLLGRSILPIGRESLQGAIKRRNTLPNWRMRWCTVELKIKPFAAYLLTVAPAIFYVGLRFDEEEREGGDYANVPAVEMRFPMREWGWNLDKVLSYLVDKGVKIPKRTDCAICFFQRLSEWYELWVNHPDKYQEGIDLEDQTGYTFRSPGRDTWPASLRELAEEFKKGRKIRGYQKDSIAEMKCRVCRI